MFSAPAGVKLWHEASKSILLLTTVMTVVEHALVARDPVSWLHCREYLGSHEVILDCLEDGGQHCIMESLLLQLDDVDQLITNVAQRLHGEELEVLQDPGSQCLHHRLWWAPAPVRVGCGIPGSSPTGSSHTSSLRGRFGLGVALLVAPGAALLAAVTAGTLEPDAAVALLLWLSSAGRWRGQALVTADLFPEIVQANVRFLKDTVSSRMWLG